MEIIKINYGVRNGKYYEIINSCIALLEIGNIRKL